MAFSQFVSFLKSSVSLEQKQSGPRSLAYALDSIVNSESLQQIRKEQNMFGFLIFIIFFFLSRLKYFENFSLEIELSFLVQWYFTGHNSDHNRQGAGIHGFSVEGNVIKSQDRSVVNSMELVCKFDLVMNHQGEKNSARNFP